MSFHATTPSTVTQNAVAIAIPLPTRPVARSLIHCVVLLRLSVIPHYWACGD
jgi:hypothetical protein